jgi:hypothetical protein
MFLSESEGSQDETWIISADDDDDAVEEEDKDDDDDEEDGEEVGELEMKEVKVVAYRNRLGSGGTTTTEEELEVDDDADAPAVLAAATNAGTSGKASLTTASKQSSYNTATASQIEMQ